MWVGVSSGRLALLSVSSFLFGFPVIPRHEESTFWFAKTNRFLPAIEMTEQKGFARHQVYLTKVLCVSLIFLAVKF